MARAMWFFPTPKTSELPERLQGLLGKAREAMGFVPNVFVSYSYRPERFSAWFTHYKQLHEPSENLNEADRELIAVVVSAYNRCPYCIVSHGEALRHALGGTAQAAAETDYIAANWRHAGLDARRYAICEFVEKLTARPNEMAESDLAALRALGLTDHEVWDVAEIASMYNFTNRMALAMGQLPNEEYHTLDRPSST